MQDPFATPGAASWLELMTTDVEAAKQFYAELFGWTLEDMPMPGMEEQGLTYTVFGMGKDRFGGIMPMQCDEPGTPPGWGSYITVEDADATAAKAEALGGKVLLPPRDIPGVGRFCMIQDPQGAVISAITYVNPECEDDADPDPGAHI